MMYSEKQFINEAAVYLEKFRWLNAGRVANFRCPYCGDSKKNLNKCRGFFYIGKHGRFVYSCKNCGMGGFGVGKFLKQLYPSIYTSYKIERMKELGFSQRTPEPVVDDTERNERMSQLKKPTKTLVRLLDLPEEHPAKLYLISRKTPRSSWSKILYTDNYRKFIDEVCPMHDKDLPDDKRIVFEMANQEGEVFGYQGRSIDPECDIRYITIKFDKTIASIWGLQYIEPDAPVIVVEGVMDALLLPNCVAILGGDIGSASKVLLELPDVVICFDNEPRHKDTVNRMQKAINAGMAVCFWKYDPKDKDVNEMVKSGIDRKDIIRHIFQNKHSGNRAKLEMMYWKKTENTQGVKGGRNYAN